MEDLWLKGANTTGLNSAVTKPYKHNSEKTRINILDLPMGKMSRVEAVYLA